MILAAGLLWTARHSQVARPDLTSSGTFGIFGIAPVRLVLKHQAIEVKQPGEGIICIFKRTCEGSNGIRTWSSLIWGRGTEDGDGHLYETMETGQDCGISMTVVGIAYISSHPIYAIRIPPVIAVSISSVTCTKAHAQLCPIQYYISY
jgi:hypothetical protein